LPEAAIGRLFVGLGAQSFITPSHNKDHGVLATHQLTHDSVDQTRFD
jgi:hypothetical protein